MAAPKNNEFYKQVKMPTGRPKKFNPRSLWKKALEYFDWVSKHPLMEMKAFSNGKTKNVPKMRAMTETAFCLFADLQADTFRNYKSGKEEYKEFFEVANRIAQIIYTQKFEGAAAEFLNSNIIARDLGLTDKSDVTTAGESLNKGFLNLMMETKNETEE